MAKIVVPTPNTTITSAWGKSVADQLNIASEPIERFANVSPAMTLGPNGASATVFLTFTATVAGSMHLDILAVVANTGSAALQQVILYAGGAGTFPTVTDAPQTTYANNAFGTVTLPIRARWANVAAGAAVIIGVTMTVAGGPATLRLDRLAGTARLWPTYP